MDDLTPITPKAWEHILDAWPEPPFGKWPDGYPSPQALGLRVVDGVVVPKEPTEAMFERAFDLYPIDWEGSDQSDAYRGIYNAMLSAAQEGE